VFSNRPTEAQLAAARRDALRARQIAAEHAEQAQRLAAELAARPPADLDRIIGGLVKSRLLVFLIDGTVYDGLLIDADERTLVLADVHRRGDGTVSAVPGELYQDRGRVAYVQRVAADQPGSA